MLQREHPAEGSRALQQQPTQGLSPENQHACTNAQDSGPVGKRSQSAVRTLVRLMQLYNSCMVLRLGSFGEEARKNPLSLH